MSRKGEGHGEGAKHSFLATRFVNCWPVLSTLWQERLTTHLVPLVFGREPELTGAQGQWVKASPWMMVKPEETAPFPFSTFLCTPPGLHPNPYCSHSWSRDWTPHLLCPPPPANPSEFWKNANYLLSGNSRTVWKRVPMGGTISGRLFSRLSFRAGWFVARLRA